MPKIEDASRISSTSPTTAELLDRARRPGEITRFLLRGGEAGEVRYFDPNGAFIGLSSFRSSPDPSTCNGVRRWPEQVTCDAPVVIRELCADRASGHIGAGLDASQWLDDLGGIE